MPVKTKPPAIKAIELPGQIYSTCVQIGNHYHFSGLVAITSDKQPDGDLDKQAPLVLGGMVELLQLCGLTADDVYSATIALAGDMAGYDLINRFWDILFATTPIKPRRMVFAVAALPFGCAIEVQFDAVKQA